jgi:hypothetical protein
MSTETTLETIAQVTQEQIDSIVGDSTPDVAIDIQQVLLVAFAAVRAEQDADLVSLRADLTRQHEAHARYERDVATLVGSLRAEIERLKMRPTAEFSAQESKPCVWHFDDGDDASMWETSCGGAAFEFTNDGPAENGFRFCYSCGKHIEISRTSDESKAEAQG